MNQEMRQTADIIINEALAAVMPDNAVEKALRKFDCTTGRTVLVAAGKAAWQMASAAVRVLGNVDDGIVITKYDHVMGEIPGVTCFEAGHPGNRGGPSQGFRPH